MAILKDSGVNFSKIDLMDNGNHCYLVFNGRKLHAIVALVIAESDMAVFKSNGYEGSIRSVVLLRISMMMYSISISLIYLSWLMVDCEK